MMEVFLDVPWVCFLCGVPTTQSTYQLAVLNKYDVIVNDNNRHWIRCIKCLKSFHLSCLSSDDGQFFDDHVIFRKSLEPFLCKKCCFSLGDHSGKCE